jgi:hypothetical protein
MISVRSRIGGRTPRILPPKVGAREVRALELGVPKRRRGQSCTARGRVAYRRGIQRRPRRSALKGRHRRGQRRSTWPPKVRARQRDPEIQAGEVGSRVVEPECWRAYRVGLLMFGHRRARPRARVGTWCSGRRSNISSRRPDRDACVTLTSLPRRSHRRHPSRSAP